MALVLVNGGEDIALKALVNHTAGQNLVLRLYRNDYTPVETSVAGDFTEANFTGYAALTLSGISWTVVAWTPTYAAYAQQTFTMGTPGTTNTIYGYYVTQATSGLLVIAERFPSGPYSMANSGDVIRVTPNLTCD